MGVPQAGVTPGLPLGHKGCGLYSFQESVFTKHSFKSLPPAWELRAGTSAKRMLSLVSGWIQENSFLEFFLFGTFWNQSRVQYHLKCIYTEVLVDTDAHVHIFIDDNTHHTHTHTHTRTYIRRAKAPKQTGSDSRVMKQNPFVFLPCPEPGTPAVRTRGCHFSGPGTWLLDGHTTWV